MLLRRRSPSSGEEGGGGGGFFLTVSHKGVSEVSKGMSTEKILLEIRPKI